ncbi:MAG: DUF1479 domain-containing protein [Alphaproteobacteria bacterium]
MDMGKETAKHREVRREIALARDTLGCLDLGVCAEYIRDEVAKIRREDGAGGSAVPELEYGDIAAGNVSAASVARIRHRGCVVVRQVYSRERACAWDCEIGDYITENSYRKESLSRRGMDRYFSGLASGAAQIFALYWSRAQVEARQGEEMVRVRRFLNGLWDHGQVAEFDGESDYVYADRLRRRRAGDTTLGLSPHIDGGSYERWTDSAWRDIYAAVFRGEWQDYNPWLSWRRTEVENFPSPAVCSMFRSFQGWIALSAQGRGDGTLQLVPITNGIVYLLLRALQEDCVEEGLCGAEAGRALGVLEAWHGPLLEGLVTIPRMEPGDGVWWHPDLVHGVEREHLGHSSSNVIYVGASPRCERNRIYGIRQARAFLEGRSPSDFAAEDYEVSFTRRARMEDLSATGRAQMTL